MERDIEGEVSGRVKHFYSIYNKMLSRQKAFEDIYDLVAIRVIVPRTRDCYEVLGTIHALWKHWRKATSLRPRTPCPPTTWRAFRLDRLRTHISPRSSFGHSRRRPRLQTWHGTFPGRKTGRPFTAALPTRSSWRGSTNPRSRRPRSPATSSPTRS